MEDLTENKDMLTVGDMLRDARNKKNITLDAAAEELCIRKFYLNAIENMDFENIPPMPYGLGFVRSYAKFLGLNSDRIVLAYRLVMTGEEEPKPLNDGQQRENSAPRLKHFLFGLVGLILLGAAWSVLPTNSDFEDTTEENNFTLPEQDFSAEKAENEDTVKENSATEENEEPTAKEDEETTTEPKADEEKVTEKEKTEKIEENEPTEKADLPKMKIVLTGRSWLDLRRGNKVLISNVYNKGYTYEIPAGKGFVVSVGVPRNVQFFLGDKQIPVVSSGKRNNVSLDSYFEAQD